MMHSCSARSSHRKIFKLATALVFFIAPLLARVFFAEPSMAQSAAQSTPQATAQSKPPLVTQPAPPATAARMLLLPRRIVSGDRATLAVLDVNGRLTPGATIHFSNGDHYTTDATGRALFVAPLNPGVVYATLPGRAGRVATTVLSPAEIPATALQVSAAPRVASIADRFELSGTGFCGDADANHVSIAGQNALVLAASPTTLIVLPPQDLAPGRASVEIACGKQTARAFYLTLVSLELEASSAPLAPGEHRTLEVHVRGTLGRVLLEARNLAPDVAELATKVAATSQAGNPTRAASSGGAENIARFELVGKKRGSFLVSIRLISATGPPRS
jgi:hypothetical protein